MKRFTGLLVLVVVISGCTYLNGAFRTETPIGAVLENPDLYLGKEIMIRGEYVTLDVSTKVIQDTQNRFLVPTHCERSFVLGREYAVTGVIGIHADNDAYYRIDCEGNPTPTLAGNVTIEQLREGPEKYFGKRVVVQGIIDQPGGPHMQLLDEQWKNTSGKEGFSVVTEGCPFPGWGKPIEAIGILDWWGSMPVLYCGDPDARQSVKRFPTAERYTPISQVSEHMNETITIRGDEVNSHFGLSENSSIRTNLGARDNGGGTVIIKNCPVQRFGRPHFNDIVSRGVLKEVEGHYVLVC